jgi:DNA-binding MarR family transcriptional regulator
MMDRIGASATGSQIANMLERNPNTLSMIFDRMTEAGLIERARDMKDRRQVRIIMTQKGKNKLNKTAESGWKIIERLAETFTEEEMKTFVALIEKLQAQTYKVLVPVKIAQQAGISQNKINKPKK